MTPPFLNPWREVALGEVIEIYDRMRVPLSIMERSQKPGPYPYYGASGIIDYIDDYIFDGRYLLIAEDGENLRSRKTPIAFFATGKFWVNNHAHVVRAMPELADDYFLLSCIQASGISPYITGAAQPKLSQTNLKAIRLKLPPLPTQRKIAAILSAYDDLIENNTRRIAILEEMAQAIYREWFVHFRFPGHEQAAMVNSELGLIPEGWEVVKFADTVTLLRQGIKPYEFEDEVFAHYSFPAFDTACMPLLERGETIRSSKYLVDGENVLLSKLNPRIPRVWLPFPDTSHRAIASTEFLVLLPKKPLTRPFLYSLCQSLEFLGSFAALALGTSTSHQRVKPQDFMDMHTVLPPQSLIDALDNAVDPMLRVIHAMRLKNVTLRQTRDLLLPRLISGEVDVSELPIDTGLDIT